MRIPVVLQADAAECGIACLAMVAAHFGHRETLREYRSKFRVSQRGTTLANLRNYAEKLGFQGRAVKVELEELALLRRPAILHWEFDHFVVLTAVGRKKIRIVDPALGERALPMAEVNDKFTGIALELLPTPTLKPRKAEEAIRLGTFFPAFKGLGASLSGVFLMTVALQAFALAMPLHVQFTIDQGVRQGDWNLTVALAVGFGLVGLVSVATQWLRTLLAQFVGNTSSFRMVAGLGHHLLRLPDPWFEARHTGDVMSRFASTEPVREFLMTGIFSMIVDSAMALGALAILVAYSPKLALVAAGFLIVILGIRLGTFDWLRNLTRETIIAGASEDTSFIENVERHRAIKLLGAESSREDVWVEHLVAQLNSHTRLVRFNSHLGFATSALATLQGVLLLMLGAGLVIDGSFTLGMFIAFSAYAATFSGHAQSLIERLISLRMLRLHRERIADIAIEEPEPSMPETPMRSRVLGGIEIRGLRFSYDDDSPEVFGALDLQINQGEFLALEGASGTGKSTLIKLLCKLIQAQEGVILLDGVDLRGIDTKSYRRRLGIVMQDDDLFTGNLLDNIAVELDTLDLERVEHASRMACLHDDVMRMPMEYMTRVGNMGSTLSGGQKQRVMIARAIYRQPAIFLLDEGTAHLNDELQQQVLSNLRSTGATIIAATHDERVSACADRRVSLVPGDTGGVLISSQ